MVLALVARRSSLVARRSSLVARRSSLVAVAVVVLTFPGLAGAINITENAQVGVSRDFSAGEQYSIWVRTTDGNLRSRRDNATGSFIWTNHGLMAGQTIRTEGVSATGWISGGAVYERVYYVDSGGRIAERAFVNRSEVTSAGRKQPPTGKTLSGHIAATWAWESNGTRYVRVYATTVQGDLYVFRVNASTGTTYWVEVESGGIDATAPLAASTSPDHDYTRVFASTTSNSVHMWRYDGTIWTLVDIGSPPGPVSVFGTAVAVEDQLDSTQQDEYRVYLLCTKKGATSSSIYVAYATLPNSNAFAWGTTLSLPSGAVRNTGYAIAATSRADGEDRAIDAWVLDTNASATKAYYTVRRKGVYFTTPADLGADGESGVRRGGLAGIPRASFDTWLYYIGRRPYGGASAANRLYRRVGAEGYSPTPPNIYNHQTGDPTHVVPDGRVPPNPHVEPSMAFYGGRGIAAAIVRGTDPPVIETAWSGTDGDEWTDFAATLTAPQRNPPFTYFVDPSTDFTDDGTAYVLVLGVDWDCQEGTSGQADAYYYTTQDGDTFSAASSPIDDSYSVDHPFLAVYRRAGQDLIRFAWYDQTNSAVKYRTMPAGDPIGPVNTLSGLGYMEARGPYMSVGASGATYVAWASSVRGTICRINAADDDCRGYPFMLSGVWRPDRGVSISIPVPGENLSMMTGSGWSIQASPTNPDKVYYAFQAYESQHPTRLDLFFSVGTFSDNNTPADESDDYFTFSQPIAITDTNDDHDQFQPALTVSRDGTSGDNIFVSWYDRRNGTCEGYTDRCYDARRAVSFNGGASFSYMQVTGTLSDPALLPTTCKEGEEGTRTPGDYHLVTGELLHSQHVMVEAPVGSTAPSAVLRDA